MTPAATFLILVLFAVAVLGGTLWLRHRVRSPLRSVDEFHTAMRALAPRGRRRG